MVKRDGSPSSFAGTCSHTAWPPTVNAALASASALPQGAEHRGEKRVSVFRQIFEPRGPQRSIRLGSQRDAGSQDGLDVADARLERFMGRQSGVTRIMQFQLRRRLPVKRYEIRRRHHPDGDFAARVIVGADVEAEVVLHLIRLQSRAEAACVRFFVESDLASVFRRDDAVIEEDDRDFIRNDAAIDGSLNL